MKIRVVHHIKESGAAQSGAAALSTEKQRDSQRKAVSLLIMCGGPNIVNTVNNIAAEN